MALLEALRLQRPEVLDVLARSWKHPQELRRTFEALSFGQPRGSLPLSFPALMEVAALQNYATMHVHRVRTTAWDEALDAGH